MSGWFFSEEVSHLGHDAGLEGFSRRSVKVVQLRLERWWFQAIWKMGRWKSLATNERWIYVNAWNIVTLLVSTSWFQFQVFRSFIQTELIRKNLWNHHLECKKKKILYKWMLHTFYPTPPPKKKKEKRMVQIWHQNSPSSPNHRECSNASKPGTFPRLIQAWIGVMSFDSCKEPGRLRWLNQQRLLKAALNSICW